MKESVKKSLVPLLLIILLTGLFAYKNPSERFFEIAKNLDIFATLFKEVNAYYVDEINPNTLMRTGIDAMLKSLDPYTNYIPEDDIEDYRTMTTNQYGGIGASIGKNNEKNIILMPYPGYPAHKNGIKIGDEILRVDDVDVSDKTTEEISKLLKGQANTNVKVTVRRYQEDEPLDFELKREKITIDNVPYFGMIQNDIGYIKLSDFTTSAGKEVDQALTKLKQKGASKVILDLRGNPGGLLSEAVNVTNVFIPKGQEVVSTKGKVTEWNKTYRTLNNPNDTEIPIAVLINNRSASAAEIVAGTIQDYDRGVLIGKKTYGKGLVQATRPLTYNSQLKVTTAKYYIPSGRCIQSIIYSERNEDGSVKKIPDSLKVEFETQNGRKVYDGGGIDPDIDIANRNLAPITISLISKGLLFDYATEYFYKHESITGPREFYITETIFSDFVNWLQDKDYDYESKVEKTLDNLIEISKEEKFNGIIEAQILDLKSKIEHNKEKDLQKFKDEIKIFLKEEIVTRYYLTDGSVESSFENDLQLQAAIQSLDEPDEYNTLLNNN